MWAEALEGDLRGMLKILVLAACICFAVCAAASAAVVYQEDFSTGARLFGDERGMWTTTGGVYSAKIEENIPPNYSSLPLNLRDFSIELDVNGISDGGVWLRSRDNNGQVSGVLLVTGGWLRTGRGFYWHVVTNDGYGPPVNEATPLFTQGDNVHIRVTVQGDTYSVYLNGGANPVTTLTTSQFQTGAVGLYDYSSQTFDNVKVTVDAQPIAIGLRSARHDIISEASARWLFSVHGTVTFVMQGAIEIDDGSGDILNIYCDSVSGVTFGSFIRATGLLFKNGPVTDLSCLPSAVELLN